MPSESCSCILLLFVFKSDLFEDFPGGPVIQNLPTNAGYGLIPGHRTIPRAEGQLSWFITTIEPVGSRAHTPRQEEPPQ